MRKPSGDKNAKTDQKAISDTPAHFGRFFLGLKAAVTHNRGH